MNKERLLKIISVIGIIILIVITIGMIIGASKFAATAKADKEKLDDIMNTEISIIDDNMLDTTELKSFRYVDEIGGLGKATRANAEQIIQFTIEDLAKIEETKELLDEDLKFLNKKLSEINKMEKELNNLTTLSKKHRQEGQKHIENCRGTIEFDKMFVQDDFKILFQMEYKLLDLQSRASFVR